VASIADNEREVHLAADMGHQVLAQYAEQGPKEEDEHYPEAKRVEQSPLVLD
jgi:hypothetical protein